MNDALLVRRFQRFGNLTRDGQRLFQRNRPECDSVCERRPIDQLQHQRLRAVRLFEAVDRADVRVIERGEQLRFAREPRQAVRIEREPLGQHLQGDVAIQLRVARAIHLAHGARTKRGDDFVGTHSKTRGEDCVRQRAVHRRRWGSERIGKHRLTGDGQPIEEADVRGVRRQQRLDFTTQRLVVTSRSGQKGVALFGRPFHSGLKQRLHSRPSLVGHGRTSEPSSRLSHAFAVRQSRLAVDGDTLRTCAASSIVSPPNARSSTILASSASIVSRRSSA